MSRARPPARRAAPRRIAVWALVGVAAFVVLTLGDRWLFHLLNQGKEIERHDWYQALRAVGYLPVWLAIAVVVALTHRGGRRGAALALAPALAGLAAEILKLLVGRERPIPHDGAYVFKPFLGAFVDGSNLGMPSSHAAVAFGGAIMAAMIWPRAWAPLILAATGCALTRLLSGAHFATDVFVGAALAYAVCALLRGRLLERRL